MRRVVRHIYHIGVILLFVLVAVAGFTQTKTFKGYLLSVITSEINASVQGSVWISSLDGNLITGLNLRDIEVAEADREIARIPEIRISYDVVGFLLGNVRLSSVEIIQPYVFLYRRSDGTMNLSDFLPAPSAEEGDTVESSSPAITLRDIRIRGGHFRMIDSLSLNERERSGLVLPDRVIDYSDLNLRDIQLSAALTMTELGTRIEVASLSCDLPRHAFAVQDLSGTFELLGGMTRVSGMELVTGRSRLQLDARLDKGLAHINLLDELRDVDTEVRLRAYNLDMGELRAFLYPHLEFLDRSVNLDVQVSGPFHRLSVDRLMLQTPGSYIQLRGVLSNLHRPEYLEIAAESGESVVGSDDIRGFLPGLSIPSWDRFGDPVITFSFVGKPTDFDAGVTAFSERGTIGAQAKITIGKFLSYKGAVATEDLDLGGFMEDGTELSRLNATIEIDGSGTDLPTLIATTRLRIDSSEISGVDIQRAIAVFDAGQGIISGHLDAVTDNGSIVLSGRTTHGPDGELLTYGTQASVRGFNLAPLSGVESYESDLNMDITAGGDISAESSSDTVRIAFLESMFGSRAISPSAVNLRQNISDERRTISLESVPAHLQVSGKYAIEDLPRIGAFAVDVIREVAERTFVDLDAIRSFGPLTATGTPVSVSGFSTAFDTSDINIIYEMRSLEPLGALAGLTLTGDATGSFDLVGTPTDFQASGRLNSGYFDLDDESIRAAGRTVELDFFADRLASERRGDHTGTSVTLGADAIRLNETLLSGVAIRADIQDSTGMLSVQSLVDSTIQVNGIGALRRTERFTEIIFDQLRMEVNAFSVQTMDSMVAVLGSDGVLIQDGLFGTDGERIRLGGIFNPVGVSDLRVDLVNVRASHLPDILAHTPTASTVQGLSGRINASMLFRGSFDHPNVQLELTGEDVALDRVRFGRLNASIGYFERLLSMDVSLDVQKRDQTGTPDLLLRGTVPFDFSISDHEEDEPLQGDIDLVMISTGIDMSFFEPFLASVTRELEGTLTCNIRMTGDVNEPQYEGMATIRGGSLVFVPTKMRYQLNGNFLTEADRIRLQNVVVRNTTEDYADGLMNVSGTLELAGISLRGFDLGFNGELRLMREDSSRILGNPYYGDLTVATADQGLSWSGSIERSRMSGQMLVRNAQLTLPPDRDAQQYSTRLIDIIRDPDSSKARARLAIEALDKAFAVSETTEEEEQPSFVDRINFDLTLETQGPTQIRFIFNTQANDVLFADLRGRLSFLRDPSSTRLIGDIEVTDRSYYNFLKRFSASGRLLFTGDPLDPELDILARYQGIHKKVVGDASVGPDGGPAQTVDERTTVLLSLKGPRSQLQTAFDIEVEDPNSTEGVRRLGEEGGNTDVEADAIAFIMTGQFRDELTEQQRTGLLGENLGYGLASGLLTGPLSETLRRTTRGSIQSLDVIYYGGGQFTEGADVRVTGQLGEAIYRVGGRVFDSIDNTNVIVEIPLSALLNSNELRNLILTLERRVEGTEQLEDQRRSSNEARLQYRIRF